MREPESSLKLSPAPKSFPAGNDSLLCALLIALPALNLHKVKDE
jgi:hypothetical protein